MGMLGGHRLPGSQETPADFTNTRDGHGARMASHLLGWPGIHSVDEDVESSAFTLSW